MSNCYFTGCVYEVVAICSCDKQVLLCKDHLIPHMMQCGKQINPKQYKNKKKVFEATNKLYLLQHNLLDFSIQMFKIIKKNFLHVNKLTHCLIASLNSSVSKSETIQEQCLKEAEEFKIEIGSLEDFNLAVQQMFGILPEEQRLLSAKEQKIKMSLLDSEINKLKQTISLKERENEDFLKNNSEIKAELEVLKRKFLEKERENADLLKNSLDIKAELEVLKRKCLEKERDPNIPDTFVIQVRDSMLVLDPPQSIRIGNSLHS